MPEGDVFEALLLSKFSITTPTALYTKAAMDKYVDFDEFERAGFLYEDFRSNMARPVIPCNSNSQRRNFHLSRVIENSHSHPKERRQETVCLLQAAL